MLLYVLDYVFLLNLSLETPESAFERLTFIQYYLCQSEHLLGDEGVSYSPAIQLSRSKFFRHLGLHKIKFTLWRERREGTSRYILAHA